MLAYHTAVAKGTDVDQPRNLAKSVTVNSFMGFFLKIFKTITKINKRCIFIVVLRYDKKNKKLKLLGDLCLKCMDI